MLRIRAGEYAVAPDGPVSFQPALWLVQRTNVRILGDGASSTVIRITDHGPGLLLLSCREVQVAHVRFSGPGRAAGSNAHYYALLQLAGTNAGIQVTDCAFERSGSHGIAHLYGPRASDHSEFRRNYFRAGGNTNHVTLGADGAAIAVGGSDNVFSDNTVEDWFRGVELEASESSHPTTNNLVHANRFFRCLGESICSFVSHGDDAQFSDNTISQNTIAGTGSSTGLTDVGIFLTGGRRWTISSNAISSIHQAYGIGILSAWAPVDNVSVVGNTIDGTRRTAIGIGRMSAGHVSRVHVAHNQVRHAGDRGVYVAADEVTIVSNRISEVQWPGIEIDRGRGFQVSDNFIDHVYAPEGYAISVGPAATNAVVRHNVAYAAASGNLSDQGLASDVALAFAVDPQPALLGVPQREGNGFHCNLWGAVGATYTVLASSNLVTWLEMGEYLIPPAGAVRVSIGPATWRQAFFQALPRVKPAAGP